MVILLNIVLALIVLLSSAASAGVNSNIEEIGFESFYLQQKDWVQTDNKLSWPHVSWAEARLGDETWIDYEVSFIVTPEEYGEEGELRLYFRQTFPFLTYSLNIDSDRISISRFDGNPETSRVLEEVEVGIKALESAKIDLRVNETEFTVLLNDKVILEAESVKYKYGGVAFFANNAKFSVTDFSLRGRADKEKENETKGYFPKNDPRSDGISDLMLIYNNYGHSWTMLDALPYVTYLGPLDTDSLDVRDWFFDSFLFLALTAPGGHAFDSPARGTPATKTEWQWFIDTIFEDRKQLAAFDRAYDVGKEHLGTEQRGKIFIMIPNPMAQIKDFGDVDGTGSLDFSHKNAALATDHRFRAVKWYIDQVIERFESSEFKNLDLAGFYWVEEMIHYSVPGEADLIRQVSEYVQDKGMKHCWIPWFNASGHGDWESLGFDFVIHQPNHMFSSTSTTSRFVDVSRTAIKFGQGIEIEADGRILSDSKSREKFLDYLRGGVTFGYMKDAVHGYYQDVRLFSNCALSGDPSIRKLYDLVYQFVNEEFDEPLGAKENFTYW